MNVVDTSGWLEYFAGGPQSKKFLEPIKDYEQLIVPTICIYEISKVVLRESDEHHLIQALAVIQKGKVAPLTPTISISAAKISLQYQLPMADSIIYATANNFNAALWTQDVDFEGLPNVHYFAKLKR